MKSYTDINQSKKLAEFLPLESADICYIKHSSSNNPNWEFNEDFPPMILGHVPINKITVETLPCWSLTALLGILPNENILIKTTDGKYYCLAKDVMTKHYDNPIDACYDMIMRLNKLKIL
jgi:hypothetical protein